VASRELKESFPHLEGFEHDRSWRLPVSRLKRLGILPYYVFEHSFSLDADVSINEVDLHSKMFPLSGLEQIDPKLESLIQVKH
jgi:hypothetical protein